MCLQLLEKCNQVDFFLRVEPQSENQIEKFHGIVEGHEASVVRLAGGFFNSPQRERFDRAVGGSQ